VSVDLQSIKVGIGLFHEALESLKALKDFLPKGTKRDQVEAKLADAGRQIALGESQLALSLGYKLCKCTFPPTIMLRTGLIDGRENCSCPQCGADSVNRSRPTKAITQFDPFDY
jgi:hypothetical protein